MNYTFMMWLFVLCVVFLPNTSKAFYEWEDEELELELRGFVRGVGLTAKNPSDNILFEHDKVTASGVFGRLMLDISSRSMSVEIHIVQSVLADKLRTGGSRFNVISDAERSDGLHWRYDEGHADLMIDRLNVQYQTNDLRLKVGRQPINLATTFYFTPNDFFAPFSAQAFFRTYKQSVDSARIDWQWSNDSSLSLIAVMDYKLDLSQPTGWETSPDWAETAYLSRISTLSEYFELGLLVAKVSKDEIIGFDFQGEVFDLFGLRGEGHIRFTDKAKTKRDSKFSLAIDKRWQNTLTLRLEHFYQHSGAKDSAKYQVLGTEDSNNAYLARNYTAIGSSYDFSPLWQVDTVYLFNHQDTSKLLALYSLYVLSDESELSIGINIPLGKEPDFGRLKTEFGSFSQSLTVEYRVYF